MGDDARPLPGIEVQGVGNEIVEIHGEHGVAALTDMLFVDELSQCGIAETGLLAERQALHFHLSQFW